MRESDRYNGWTNWETWNFKLWLDNDDFLSKHFHEVAKVTLEDDKIEYKISDVEKYLREYADDSVYDHIDDTKLGGWMADFLTMTMKEVDYYEIALSLLKDEGYDEDRDSWNYKPKAIQQESK